MRFRGLSSPPTAPPCDVLVIGGGVAGLCAAIAARRGGARVRLIESAPKPLRGGDARHARNFRVPHDAPTPYLPGSYTAQEFLAEMQATCGALPLAKALIAETADLPDWLLGCGVRLQRPEEGVIPFSRRTAFLYGGGKTMINALYRRAENAGVSIAYETTVRRLAEAPDGGWLAELGEDGEAQTEAAGAVVVASGGPVGDAGFRREHIADHLIVRGGVHSDGRLMRALIDGLGAAAIGDPSSCHMVAVDARGPPFDGGVVTRVTAIPYGLVVDRQGNRLADEGGNRKRTHYAQWGPRIASAPEGVAYLILDGEGLRRAAPLALPPQPAPTLGALARAYDLPEAALAHAGLPAPPYYVAPLRAGVIFAHFGLAVDEDLRIAGRDGRFRPGLFAAGTIMTANVFSRGYLAGLGLTLAAATGRRAGEKAAAYVRG